MTYTDLADINLAPVLGGGAPQERHEGQRPPR